MKSKKTILLGVDPSFYTMGVAIYKPSNKVRQFKLFTGDMLEVISWLSQNCKMKEVIAVVENPALDSAVFGAWDRMKKAIATRNMGSMKYEFNMIISRAQKVGENKAAAKLFMKLLSDKGVPILEVAPSVRQKAFTKNKQGHIERKKVQLLRMPTKTTQEQFSELTGHNIKEGNTEHSRDAATLVFGRTVSWVENQILINDATISRKTPASMPSKNNFNYHILKRKRS